jgi:anti-sigma factor (TIGR02949 family)
MHKTMSKETSNETTKPPMTAEKKICDNFSWEGIYLYLDGQVSEEQKRQIDEHLHKCLFCNDCKELEEAIRSILKIKVNAKCPCELLEAIKQKIKEENGQE